MSPKLVGRIVTAASVLWFVAVGFAWRPLFGTAALNLLLLLSVFPMVWQLWALAQASAHQHAERYARDVEEIHGRAGRPRPLPHQEVVR